MVSANLSRENYTSEPCSSVPSPNWLLFDYGGVLAEEGFHDTFTELSSRAGRPPEELPAIAMDAVYESGYVTGHGNESDFWSLLRSRFPLGTSDNWLSEEILRRFTLRPAMLELVDQLRSLGYHTAILSDQTDWLDRLELRDHFFNHFDHVYNSYYLGSGKRDAATFDMVLQSLSIAATGAIFIDDNPENIQRAQSRGIQGIHFTNKASLCLELSELLDQRLSC